MTMKTEKEEITDEMIGEADKACACSAVVGEIIKATNEAKKKKFSWKQLVDRWRVTGGEKRGS
jgi:hypothetical protein